MVLRWLAPLLVAVLVSACAGTDPDFGGPSLVAKAPVGAPPAKQQSASLAATVLASVALERVTGQGPAPIAGGH